MKNLLTIMFATLLLLVVGCREDSESINESIDMLSPPTLVGYSPEMKPVTSSVTGEVISDRGSEPVAGARVTLGNRTTTTDDYGLFEFKDVNMNEKGTYITVTQNSFFEGSRRFFPREGVTSRVVIELINKVTRPAFAATAGGTITIDQQATVTFPPNSIVNAAGEVFDGEVQIAAAYLDPTENTTANRMPGNLQGVRTDLEEVVLTTFGMINVSLEDSNGNPLNIRDGFTATITMPIHDQYTTAPDEIPLWSFNETFGVWAEEGSATKINGNYVGEVSHFSWWNCDVPSNFINLDMTLIDQEGIPLEHYQVGLGFPVDSSACYYGYTSDEGFVSGAVPIDQELLLIIKGLCGETIYSTTIGPFAEDTSLGELVLTGSSLNNTHILGSLVDCTGDPITNGGVIIRIGDRDYTRTVDNGAFDFQVSTCSENTDFEVIGLDFSDQKESDPFTGQTGTTVDFGSISVCDNMIEESILNINIGGQGYIYSGMFLNGEIDQNNIRIQYSPVDSLEEEALLIFNINGTTPGEYGGDNFSILYDYTVPWALSETDSNSQSIVLDNLTISEVSPNIVGTFSDTLVEFSGNEPDTVFVSGDFLIIQ